MTIKHIKFRNEDKNISPSSLLDEEVGKFLKMELEKEYNISLPSNADWGYTFRIRIRRTNYHIIIEFGETPKYLRIRIIPALSVFQKLFKNNWAEQDELADKILEKINEKYPNLTHY